MKQLRTKRKKKKGKKVIYQVTQTNGELEHRPLIVDHWVNFYSEKKHTVPSSAANNKRYKCQFYVKKK